jgi:hypothetical protein
MVFHGWYHGTRCVGLCIVGRSAACKGGERRIHIDNPWIVRIIWLGGYYQSGLHTVSRYAQQTGQVASNILTIALPIGGVINSNWEERRVTHGKPPV